MVSEELYNLCTDGDSVSYLLATNLNLSPREAWHNLYGHRQASVQCGDSGVDIEILEDSLKQNSLQRARDCGHWGPTKPSDLFLRVSCCKPESNIRLISYRSTMMR